MKKDIAKWIYFKVRKTLMSFLKRSLIFSPNTGKNGKEGDCTKEINGLQHKHDNNKKKQNKQTNKKTDPPAGTESHALPK